MEIIEICSHSSIGRALRYERRGFVGSSPTGSSKMLVYPSGLR
jgi:hypothetical protein